MSDKMRWRNRDTKPVVAAVDSATVIEIGDLVWQDEDDAKPASNLAEERFGNVFTGQGSVSEQLQHEFAHEFLGVAMQRSRSGDTAPVPVATTGVFEFDCPSGTFELGDLVGVGRKIDEVPEFDEPTFSLANQQVVKVTARKYAIARVAKREPAPVTSVLVDIRSRVMTNGIL